MNLTPSITTDANITLVTLQKCPSELNFIADIFQKIAKFGVDVDMISLSPTQGAYTSVSFTISDDHLDKILSFTSELQNQNKISAVVSSGNYKISVYDANMKNSPGVAAEVFCTASQAQTDIRLITTSEVDISLLITAADFQDTLKALEKRFKKI